MNPNNPQNGVSNLHRLHLITAACNRENNGGVLPPNIVTLLKAFTDTALQQPWDHQHMLILVGILNELTDDLEEGLDRLEVRLDGMAAMVRGAPEGAI